MPVTTYFDEELDELLAVCDQHGAFGPADRGGSCPGCDEADRVAVQVKVFDRPGFWYGDHSWNPAARRCPR
jgi:hypothetical protein